MINAFKKIAAFVLLLLWLPFGMAIGMVIQLGFGLLRIAVAVLLFAYGGAFILWMVIG